MLRFASPPWSAVLRLSVLALAAVALAACGAPERIANIGATPTLSPIENPVEMAGYQPVRMPMPAPRVSEPRANSLWQPGSRAFFRDQRAGNIGDILTVTIRIDDRANMNNETRRGRSSSEDAGLNTILGFERTVADFLDVEDLTNAVDFGATSSSTGTGRIQRREQIQLQVAAVVTDVLPNGNLVVFGRQEVRVNYEVRELAIAGIIRPEDISNSNTISYDKIAEARIVYGGRGHITDMQQPRYGQQLYDIIFPF